MKRKLLYTIIIFMIFAALISLVNFIRSWAKWQLLIIVLAYLIIAILGIVYLFKLRKENYISGSTLKITGWIKSILMSILLIGGIYLLFMFTILFAMGGFFGPYLEKEVKLNEETIYVYYNTCSIPNSNCGCDHYSSLIYKKNHYLPIMHLVKEVDYYVGEIQLHNGRLYILASDDCKSDIGKSLVIEL
ncbi:MAG: hypothetical protein GY754_45665 [bacterium]|nr:hypothetical protein [bacterium]